MIVSAHDPDLITHLLDARYARRWLAEGDSWFSIGGATGNLLMALDRPDVLIVNCASPGDTLRDMHQFGGDAFSRLLEPTDGVPPWNAVLLSGGGNDLLCHCARFVVPDVFDPIDDDALLETLDGIETELIRMMRLITAQAPDVPVYIGLYDYPPVDRRWWWWKLGPWIAPVFERAGIDRTRWDSLATELIDELATRILNVAQDYYLDGVPRLRVVDTRMRLTRDQWQNEIHPTRAGYDTLATVWARALEYPTTRTRPDTKQESQTRQQSARKEQ